MKVCIQILTGLLITIGWASHVYAQSAPSDLEVFGYFQPQFFHETASRDFVVDGRVLQRGDPARNSFVLQQLNLFLQKDLGTKLTSFVNFEAVNNFSTDQRWGSFRLEEAWVGYRYSRHLHAKLGPQIPRFNNLNEIKNRTPLLPYVVRPLVYESSFVNVVGVRVYVPQQAFAQAFGWFQVGKVKFDYATYLGNTELVDSGFNVGPDGKPRAQTGIDTTTAILVGSRAGIRIGELKAGFSVTNDKSAVLQGAEEITGLAASRYRNTHRERFGADLSYYFRGVSLEAEWIDVHLEEPEEIDLQLSFYYATLGYNLTDRLFGYVTYWLTKEEQRIFDSLESVDIIVPGFGVAYRLEDQITLKAQYAHIDVDLDFSTPTEHTQFTNTFEYYTVAVSVTF